MAATDTQRAFYDHKRAAHNGDYKNDCSECAEKFARLVDESKAKASSK